MQKFQTAAAGVAVVILIAIAFLVSLTDFVEAQVSTPARNHPDNYFFQTTDRQAVTPSGQSNSRVNR